MGFRALGSRNYRLFFGGQLISLVGTWMQQVAQAWLVYRLTGSVTLLGALGFWSQIPVLFLAPFGGALADRFPRRQLLIAAQTAAMLLAFALAALTLTGRITVAHLFVVSALLGVVTAVEMPTRQSFVGQMVDREHLMNAISLNSTIVNGSRIVGPAIAGLLVAAVGEGWCFAINGVSFLAVIAGLIAMRGLSAALPRARTSALADLREGFRFVTDHAPVRDVLVLLAMLSLLVVPYAVLMPVFADDVLGGGARTLGILTGSTGVGALAAALALARRDRIEGLGKWLTWGSVVFGAAVIAFGWSRHVALSCALLAVGGFGMMIVMSGSNTVIQAMSPDRLRGRVMAVWGMVIVGLAPLGSLAAGAAAHRIGVPWTVTIGGGAGALAGLAFGRRLPALRASARELMRGAAAAGTE